MRSFSLLTFVSLLLCLVALWSGSEASNESLGFNARYDKRWTFTDDDTEFYDDESDDHGEAATNYANQPLAEQPVSNVIVAKIEKVSSIKPPANGQNNGRSPYDTPPGTFSAASYAGPPSNYGKNYNGQIDLYTSYLSSNSYQQYNQYCMKAYGQKPIITTRDLDQAFAYALNEVKGYARMEAAIGQKGGFVNASGPYTSSSRHQIGSYLVKLAPKAFREKEALLMEYASKFLNKYKCLNKFDTHFLLPSIRIKERPLKDISCNHAYTSNAGQTSVDCSKLAKSKYRSPDGICNNLQHPYWGKANVCHLRLVPSAYEDGISAPRSNSFKFGQKLPSPRKLSNVMHYERPDRFFYTAAVMSFGQFFNHDISFTPQTKPEYKGSLIDCCKKPGITGVPNKLHPQCLPIDLEPEDFQFKSFNKKCLNFVRSAPCALCSLGPREQMNTVTSFIDLSVTYGSSKELQDKLRAFDKGLLKTSKNKFGGDLMPKSGDEDQCSSKVDKDANPNHYCFSSGDVRANQHPMLQTFHLLFVRNHNIHAKNLAKVNPTWTDEMLFQEAKRLNIAEYQHISFEEYLPLIFGPTLTSFYNLNADGDVTYSKYDHKSKVEHYKRHLFTIYEPRTDPTSWNDYSTSACRYGHSLISSFFSLIGSKSPGFWLRDVFFNPSLMHDGQLDSVIKGLITDRAMLSDPHFSEDIKNYLYKAKDEKVGSDLVAININRARDHGLPGYTVYVDFCLGVKIKTWDDLKKFMPVETIARLKHMYADVRDIDFYTGGMSERKFPDASLGPTFACVLGIQYYHLKFGDRFFYSHLHQAGSFTPDQLLSIKESSSFANLLCKTGDNIKNIQLNPFLPLTRYNFEVPCNSLPAINYNLWKI